MTNAQLQRKLNQLTELANELDAEAKRRHGPDGFLFYEAEGYFHIMDGDDSKSMARRLTHITASSSTLCHLGAGAW